MEYKSVKGFTGWAQLGFLFAFLGFGFILTAGVQFLFLLKMVPTGTNLTDSKELMKVMLAPENIGLARIQQVLGTLLLLFLPAYLWSFVSNGRKMFWLGFSKYFTVKQVFIGILLIFAASLAAGPLADLSKSIVSHFPSLNAKAKILEDTYNAQVIALSNLKNWPEYLTALVIMAFFPAMFEEVFFRGAMQNLLVKWWRSPMAAIFVTSFLFSLIHMSIYLFLSRLLLGFVLGLMYHKTKNIWVNILAHFINNAIAVTQMFYLSRQPTKIDINSIDPHIHWSVGVLGIITLAALFYFLDKASQKKVAQIDAKENLLIAAADPFRSFTNAENN